MVDKRKVYENIILMLTARFKHLYKSNLPVEVEINCGDCYLMALLTYCIGKSVGLNPTLYCGGHHCFVMEDGLIFDAYFPYGTKHNDLPNKGLIRKDYNLNDTPNEFYKANPVKGPASLSGYFYNCPDRALYAEHILNQHQLELPIGLRKYLRYGCLYRNKNHLKNAMRNLIKRLRKQQCQNSVTYQLT